MKKRGKNLSIVEKCEIIKKYQSGEYTCSSLGKEYNKSGEAISRMLKTNGVCVLNDPANLQRKYNFNQNYFSEINTEKKAYFLGFILGDGYHHEKSNTLTIELQKDDIDILEKFNKELKLEKPIFIRKDRESAIISVQSTILSNDLIKLECRQAKSFNMDLPINRVPQSLLRHLCRGLYDADGSFSLNIKSGKRKDSLVFQSCLVVSEACCKTIGEIIKKELNIYYHICPPNKKIINNIRNLNVWGIERTTKLIDWLYSDATIYLDRKYQKYIKIKNHLSNIILDS